MLRQTKPKARSPMGFIFGAAYPLSDDTDG